MRKLLLFISAGLCGSAAAACSGHAAPVVSPALRSSAETVQPGDLLAIKIWQEPDLSDTVEVDPGGNVVLAKLGNLNLTGMSPDSAKARIISGYSKYLVNTAIDITVLRRIQVTGAVKTPSLYHVSGTMSVSDAIAMAGGVMPDGNQKRVELIRNGQVIAGDLDTGTLLADTPVRSGDQLNVPYRSWLSRNGYLAGTLLSAAATIIAIAVRN